MYVEALDRPWIETDFELEGLLLQDAQDIERVRRFCRHVYISATRADAAAEPESITPRSIPRSHPADPLEPEMPTCDRDPRSFRGELSQARKVHHQGRLLLEGLHRDIVRAQKVDTRGAREVVTQMVDSVARHPDALVWFTNLKNRDQYTALHSLNVCMLAITLATAMRIDDDAICELGVGTLLHDVGKLRVPSNILHKPGKLTDAEFSEMKKHPEYGVEILSGARDLSKDSIEVVLSHHERLDGSGYPKGLRGRQISRFSQLAAIADVYDAMTSHRVYHPGRPPAQVLEIMRGNTGAFNAEMLQQFVNCIGDYPVGSLVEINTGEVGFVVPAPQRQAKPTVLIVLDHRKRRYYPQRVRDLNRFENFKVRRVLAGGAYGVDVNDYAEFLE